MAVTLPLGIDIFPAIRKEGDYYAGKTGLMESGEEGCLNGCDAAFGH